MLAAMQANDGVHVAAVLEPETANDHPFVGRLTALGVSVTPVVVGGRSYLREYRALRALIRQLEPAIVHTHGYRSDVIGTAAARSAHVPAVSTVHGFTGGSLRNRLNELLQRFALRRSSAVLAVASPIADRLAATGMRRSKIFFVPNGFTPGDSRMQRSAARQRLCLDDATLVAGWVGRLSPEKGADVMLVALSRSAPRWHLSIVGDGPEADRLHRLADKLGIRERVTWHGAVPDAASIFPAFDAFVLSSRTEGTPIALFEAMDASVPIIAASVGGVPDVVSDNEARLVPREDPDAIAAVMNEIQHDPTAARERAVRARARLISTFSGAAWLAAVDAAYRAASAVSGNRR
jgi:glycosyltransferase involved in cell wall biosynthesis